LIRSRLPDLADTSVPAAPTDPRPLTPHLDAPKVRPAAHIFSVDVEEYFQVNAFDDVVARADWHRYPSRLAASIDLLLDMLARHDASGTFFVLGWAAKRHPQVVRAIAAAGHEIASHGWSHRKVTTLSPGEFRVELRDSKRLLEDLSGTSVTGFRAPSFSITPRNQWAFDVLLEEGYVYDSSVFPIRRPDYGFPGARTEPHCIGRPSGTLLELPLATLPLGPLRLPAAGGGYLRHLPFRLTSRALCEAERQGAPAVIYVHPWEFDPEQPRLPVGRLAEFRHYRGLGDMAPRLERLLTEFRFTSVRRSTHAEIARAFVKAGVGGLS
jgi:polysaccharide deacetylase family protein (PEP-CTERM system associated)